MNFEEEERMHTHTRHPTEKKEKRQRGDWGSGTTWIRPNCSSSPGEATSKGPQLALLQERAQKGRRSQQLSLDKGRHTPTWGPCKGTNHTGRGRPNIKSEPWVPKLWRPGNWSASSRRPPSGGSTCQPLLCCWEPPRETHGVTGRAGRTQRKGFRSGWAC